VDILQSDLKFSPQFAPPGFAVQLMTPSLKQRVFRKLNHSNEETSIDEHPKSGFAHRL